MDAYLKWRDGQQHEFEQRGEWFVCKWCGERTTGQWLTARNYWTTEGRCESRIVATAEAAGTRPCHLCGRPRGTAYVDPERHPGKLLCADCAGVRANDWLQRAFGATLDAVEAEGFEKREAIARAREILKERG